MGQRGHCEVRVSTRTQGLFAKFRVERLTPSSRGIDHTDCRYFVLDITHDPHALSAAVAYANSCESEYPFLAEDLRSMVRGVALLAKSVPAAATPSDQHSSLHAKIRKERPHA